MRFKRFCLLSLLLALLLVCAACAPKATSEAPLTQAPSATAAPVADEPAISEDEPAPDTEEPATAAFAMGNSAANLANGGFLVADAGYVFYAQNGLWRVNADGTAPVCLREGEFEHLNAWEGRLYFTVNHRAPKPAENDYTPTVTAQEIASIAYDGSDYRVLAESSPTGWYTEYVYPPEDGSPYTVPVEGMMGYRCLTLAEGRLYFIANNGVSGEYTMHMYDENGDISSTANVTYPSGASVYRMELDGSGWEELVPDVGVATPALSIDDGRLYVATSFTNVLYSYDLNTYASYDLNGGDKQELYGFELLEDTWIGSDKGYAFHILDGMQAYGGALYLSLGDSEGDFRDNRLSRIENGEETHLLYEVNFTGSVVTKDGILYLGGERDWEADTLQGGGLYTCGLDLSNPTLLAPMDRLVDYAPLQINVANGYAYLRGAYQPLLRVALAQEGLTGSGLAVLTETGFVPTESVGLAPWMEAYTAESLALSAAGKQFALYDMDSNNTPELLVRTQTADGEATLNVYTERGGEAVPLGTVEAAQELYRSADEPGLLYVSGSVANDPGLRLQSIRFDGEDLLCEEVAYKSTETCTVGGEEAEQSACDAVFDRCVNPFASFWFTDAAEWFANGYGTEHLLDIVAE